MSNIVRHKSYICLCPTKGMVGNVYQRSVQCTSCLLNYVVLSNKEARGNYFSSIVLVGLICNTTNVQSPTIFECQKPAGTVTFPALSIALCIGTYFNDAYCFLAPLITFFIIDYYEHFKNRLQSCSNFYINDPFHLEQWIRSKLPLGLSQLYMFEEAVVVEQAMHFFQVNFGLFTLYQLTLA